MTSIQELESIKHESYQSNPEELIPFVKQLLNLKKYEKAIELAEKAIHYTIKNNNNDEASLECAKFYYHYADALIRKCMESEDVLAMPFNQEIEDEDEGADEKVQQENKDQNLNKNSNGAKIEQNNIIGNNCTVNLSIGQTNGSANNINQANNIQQEEGPEVVDENEVNEDGHDGNGASAPQDDSDEQVAAENLLFAETIYQNHLSKYEKEDVNTLKEKYPEIIKTFYDLASVYQKFGELEMCKSDFKSAVEYFKKSLQVRQKYDSKFSRAIAELYFNMATAFDFDSKKCLLSYYKTKLIMEYHLKKELEANGFKSISDKIKLHEEDIDLETITPTHANLRTNRDLMQSTEICNESVLKFEEIEELVAIINELNQKMDDVIIDINDFEKYMSQQKQEAPQQTENKFTTDYDKSKVIDVTSIVKKRKREEFENPDEKEKEEGGKRVKFDIKEEGGNEKKESNVLEDSLVKSENKENNSQKKSEEK